MLQPYVTEAATVRNRASTAYYLLRITHYLLLTTYYSLLTTYYRLDRGTTGLMIIAKTARAEAHLSAQFKGRTTRKTYVALLHGRW